MRHEIFEILTVFLTISCSRSAQDYLEGPFSRNFKNKEKYLKGTVKQQNLGGFDGIIWKIATVKNQTEW